MSLTSLYGLRKFDDGEPARNVGVIVNANADTVEAALAARGVPSADAAVILAQQGAWTAYTPGLVGVTLGNGSVSGRYLKRGRTVDFAATLITGTTTAFTTAAATLGLPTPVAQASLVSGAGYRAAPNNVLAFRTSTSGSGSTPATVFVYEAGGATMGTAAALTAGSSTWRIAGTYEAPS